MSNLEHREGRPDPDGTPLVRNPEKHDGFFDSEGIALKYTLFSPDILPNQPHPSAVLIHGASSAAGRGRVLFEEFQRRLALEGIASLAYDVRGVGESEGEFAESTLEKRLVDSENAYDFFIDNGFIDAQRLAALGLSMGGHVASRLVGANPERYKGVVLVNAAAYGVQAEDKRLKPYTEFTDAIRQNFNWQSSLAFRDLARFRGPVMTVDSEFDDVVPPDVKGRYRLSIAQLDRHLVLPGIKHAFFSATDETSAQARELFYDGVTSFLKEKLQPKATTEIIY